MLAISIGVSAFRSRAEYRRNFAEVDRTYDVLRGSEALLGVLRDAETGQRGYLLTGRESYLAPYYSAQSSLSDNLRHLETVTADLPGGPARMKELGAVAAAKMAELAETITLFRTQGQAAALRVVQTNRGKEFMDRIRAELEDVQRENTRQLQNQRAASLSAVSRASLIATASSTALFVLIVLATFVIERDLERQQRDAAEIQDLNRTLERRVQDRTQALRESNAELEAFCYSVSHDLRAPLRSVEGFSKILARDYTQRPLDDRALDIMRRMSASTLRMGQLIDDLLNLSRIGRGGLECRAVDLSGLAATVLADLQSREPTRQVTVSIEPDLTIDGDARLLRIALENLLGNAWKFTRYVKQPGLEFGRAPEAGGDTFYVRDNGAGFDMAHSEQLFAPFQRLHGPHEFEGSGIGLATVQRIVHRHGGRIWATSAPGEGATFYFALKPEGRTADAPEESDPHGGGQPRRRVAHA